MDDPETTTQADAGSVAGRRGRMLELLRRQIVSGRYVPGERLPTRAALVERFEVSSLTIQRAVDRLAEEGFVTAIPRRGTFVAEDPPHLYRYGLVVEPEPEPEISPPPQWHYSRFWTALAREAETFDPGGVRRFEVRPGVDGHADNEPTRQLMADVGAGRFAGLVLVQPFSLRRRLAELSVPCVAFMRSAVLPGVLTVEVDLRPVLRRALDALAGAGRRRIALVVADTTPDETIDCFRRGLAERGMVSSPAWIHGVSLGRPHWAANAIQAVMHGPSSTLPDGLVVTDDHLLPHAARGLVEAGVRVPEALSVVGYANHGWSPEPALPVERLGYVAGDLLRRAVELIDRQNRDGDAPLVTRVEPVFEHELASRAATASRRLSSLRGASS